jgi:hypothetical protein
MQYRPALLAGFLASTGLLGGQQPGAFIQVRSRHDAWW